MELSNRNLVLVAFVAMLVIGGVVFWMTRPAYGEISEQGYAYAMALGSACNGKQTDKVERILRMIEESEDSEQLSRQEAAWLRGIAGNALDGNWEDAYLSVRTLMEEQTRPNATIPPLD